MEARYIFFKQLNLDEENKFEIDLNRDNIFGSLKFSPRREYSVTNLKINANIETDVMKWNNYKKIPEL